MQSRGVAIIVSAFCIASVYCTTASVKLLTHNLVSLGQFTNIAGGALSINGEGGKHWAIVVQFKGDNRVYICQLYRDPSFVAGRGSGGAFSSSGGIKGGCLHVTKAQATKGKKGVHVYNFGNTNTTPWELIGKANSVSINGQEYHLFLRNCQHWAKELLSKLGMSTVWWNIKKFLEKTTGPGWILSKFEKHTL